MECVSWKTAKDDRGRGSWGNTRTTSLSNRYSTKKHDISPDSRPSWRPKNSGIPGLFDMAFLKKT